jgi:enamine deaminase RidA (YjgF/YER057c/UK114 family)
VGDGDINAQIAQVAQNAEIALDAVSALPSHVVRTVVYVSVTTGLCPLLLDEQADTVDEEDTD